MRLLRGLRGAVAGANHGERGLDVLTTVPARGRMHSSGNGIVAPSRNDASRQEWFPRFRLVRSLLSREVLVLGEPIPQEIVYKNLVSTCRGSHPRCPDNRLADRDEVILQVIELDPSKICAKSKTHANIRNLPHMTAPLSEVDLAEILRTSHKSNEAVYRIQSCTLANCLTEVSKEAISSKLVKEASALLQKLPNPRNELNHAL